MFENKSECTPPQDKTNSQIQDYFGGRTIFVTGGTGSLGKLLIEKLLRTCSTIKKIYLLIREKKGMDPHERLKELFNVPAFEHLKSQFPEFFDKLSICIGDCMLPNLGLSPESKRILKEEVNCILYCAATVRFNASLRKATYTNVRSVRDFLEIAKEMNHLTVRLTKDQHHKSFVYVSTAYSNCPRKDIDEVFYEPPIAGKKLIDLVESLDDNMLDAITPILIGKWPNTYTFTKAVVENVIKTEAQNLPVAIVRPSIITGAYQEPLPGWVDNLYGVTGSFVLIGVGILKILHNDENLVFDIVPIDYVVNVILTIAWISDKKHNCTGGSLIESTSKIYDARVAREIPIYNYVSGSQNPLTWEKMKYYNLKQSYDAPLLMSLWYVTYLTVKNKYLYLIGNFLLHTLPAYIVDFLLFCLGKKPVLRKAYQKMNKFTGVLEYFCLNEWQFKNYNAQKLWTSLTPKDKELFNFDISKLIWKDYCGTYINGFRVYLMKDPLDTVPQARRRYYFFKTAHYSTIFSLLFCLFYLLMRLIFL